MKWYIRVLKQYANFGGRARRKEYWMFILFHLLIMLVLGVIDIGVQYADGENYFLLPIYTVATMLPHAAVMVRRLHDTGRSAWWLLLAIIPTVISWLILLVLTSSFSLGEQTAPSTTSPGAELLVRLIPAIGGVWLLIYMIMEGNWEANEYGEDPKKEVEEGGTASPALAYSNYERYKNNVIGFSVIAGTMNFIIHALVRKLSMSGGIEYLAYKPLFFVTGLLFATLPLLLCLLIKKQGLRTVLIVLALIEMAFSLHSTFDMMD